jgi:16S rRNA (uracil1498-N3)-methyltransferase
MRRFYLQHGAISADLLEISGAEARHITSVLRLKPGQSVEFFDGKGAIFSAVLKTTGKELVTATITGVRRDSSTSTFPLTVAQSLLKGKKMDFLIQKATELGVHTFLPLVSKYCENHGDRQRQDERWQRIMIEACKQSQRSTPMTIKPVTALDSADFSSFSHRLAAWEEEMSTALPTCLATSPGPLCLFLGPEGGLHAEDLDILRQWRFTTSSLGPRILRGETAALAAMSIIQYLTGALQPVSTAIADCNQTVRP